MKAPRECGNNEQSPNSERYLNGDELHVVPIPTHTPRLPFAGKEQRPRPWAYTRLLQNLYYGSLRISSGHSKKPWV